MRRGKEEESRCNSAISWCTVSHLTCKTLAGADQSYVEGKGDGQPPTQSTVHATATELTGYSKSEMFLAPPPSTPPIMRRVAVPKHRKLSTLDVETVSHLEHAATLNLETSLALAIVPLDLRPLLLLAFRSASAAACTSECTCNIMCNYWIRFLDPASPNHNSRSQWWLSRSNVHIYFHFESLVLYASASCSYPVHSLRPVMALVVITSCLNRPSPRQSKDRIRGLITQSHGRLLSS